MFNIAISKVEELLKSLKYLEAQENSIVVTVFIVGDKAYQLEQYPWSKHWCLLQADNGGTWSLIGDAVVGIPDDDGVPKELLDKIGYN